MLKNLAQFPFIHSFIGLLYVKCLLCAKHCAQGHGGQGSSPNSFSGGALTREGATKTVKMVGRQRGAGEIEIISNMSLRKQTVRNLEQTTLDILLGQPVLAGVQQPERRIPTPATRSVSWHRVLSMTWLTSRSVYGSASQMGHIRCHF